MRIIAIMLALMLMLSTAGFAAGDAEADVNAPALAITLKNIAVDTAILPGVTAAMSRAEAVEAGVALADEPVLETVSEDGLVTSSTYALAPGAQPLYFGDVALVGAEFQFAGDMLLGVSAGFETFDDAETVAGALAAALGEPEAIEGEGARMSVWQAGEGDAAIRLAIIEQVQDGEVLHASFQWNYPAVLDKARAAK